MLGQSSNLRPDLCHKIVLLIDRCEATREVRAGVLRSHGVECHVLPLTSAEHDFSGATQCLQWVSLDVRRQLPGEALEFYEQIRDVSSGQRFAFLVGPPLYLSLNWPGEISLEE